MLSVNAHGISMVVPTLLIYIYIYNQGTRFCHENDILGASKASLRIPPSLCPSFLALWSCQTRELQKHPFVFLSPLPYRCQTGALRKHLLVFPGLPGGSMECVKAFGCPHLGSVPCFWEALCVPLLRQFGRHLGAIRMPFGRHSGLFSPRWPHVIHMELFRKSFGIMLIARIQSPG